MTLVQILKLAQELGTPIRRSGWPSEICLDSAYRVSGKFHYHLNLLDIDILASDWEFGSK